MGVLASHVPSIEQLRPGLVEVIEESGGSKQFFCMFRSHGRKTPRTRTDREDPGSVRRLRNRPTRLKTQHQCRGGVLARQLQR